MFGIAALGAGVLSSLSSNSAAKKAAAASQYATDQNVALQREQFAQTQANLNPYMQAGQTGLDTLSARADGTGGVYGGTANPTYTAPEAFSYGANDHTASPGYQFQLQRGLDAIQSSQAARGALYSGATMKALEKFGQGLAAQDFNNERNFAYQSYNDAANRARGNYESDRGYLSNRYDTQTGVANNLASIGANAAGGLSSAGQNMATNIGNAYSQNAENKANAGLVASSNLTNILGQGLSAYARGGQARTTPGIVDRLATGVINNNPYLF